MSTKAHVIDFEKQNPIDRGTGVKTVPLAGKWIDSTSLTNGVTAFEPGAAIARHYHNCDESVTILEGEASCEVDGEVFTMKAYDTTFVPCWYPASILERKRCAYENFVDIRLCYRDPNIHGDG